MNQNYIIAGLAFGFGILTGVVLTKLMTPAPQASQGGVLENLINQIVRTQIKGVGYGVTPSQIPITREPRYKVGTWFSPDDSEHMRGHLADNVLTYL
jgi:hypothetical protein